MDHLINKAISIPPRTPSYGEKQEAERVKGWKHSIQSIRSFRRPHDPLYQPDVPLDNYHYLDSDPHKPDNENYKI